MVLVKKRSNEKFKFIFLILSLSISYLVLSISLFQLFNRQPTSIMNPIRYETEPVVTKPASPVVCIDSSECENKKILITHPGLKESFKIFLGRVYGSFSVGGCDFINQNEYKFNNFICAVARYQTIHPMVGSVQFVFHKSRSTRTDSLCDAYGSVSNQRIRLAFSNSRTTNFQGSNCSKIQFGIDNAGKCQAPMPYMTGIYDDTCNNVVNNTNQKQHRSTVLTYVGSTWRKKKKRQRLIKELRHSHYNFTVPLEIRSHEHEEQVGWMEGEVSKIAKDAYMKSIFSLQPPGDTMTRRGFYEALLLGNIPVIHTNSLKIYKEILPLETLKQMVVNISDYWNAKEIMRHIDTINASKIGDIQRAIAQKRRVLQFTLEDSESFWGFLASIIPTDSSSLSIL